MWNRIILPDTSSLTLDNLVCTDPAGYAGLEAHRRRRGADDAAGRGRRELAAPENARTATASSSPGATAPRTAACPASLKADLDRYAALHVQAYGETIDATTLIPHMLEAFMAGDRGFKQRTQPKDGKPPLREQRRLWIGARGRNRTGTTVRSRDFLTTSTFAANMNAVRGLEHAFTIALRP